MSNENRFWLLFNNKREGTVSEKEFTKEFLRRELEHNLEHPCCTSQSTFNRILNYKGVPPKIGSDILLAYSEYFNVSIDYLLCLTDIPFKDENIIKLEELGLSDKSIQILKEWNELKKKPIDIIAGYGGTDIDALNLLLEDCYYRSKKADMKGHIAGWSIFHHIYNYFFSEHLKKHPRDTVQYVHEPELRNGKCYIRRELKNGDVIISDGVKRTVEKIETYEGGHKSTSDKFPVYNEENPKETYIMSFSEIIETHAKEKILKTLERIKSRIKERK